MNAQDLCVFEMCPRRYVWSRSYVCFRISPIYALYQALDAPDRIDGRFELLTLHAGLVLRRLSALGGLAGAMAQDLVNSVFLHFDDTLREMGLSDIAVSKRLKAMGSAFYGRNTVYAAALDEGSAARLAEALARNVYGATDPDAAPGVKSDLLENAKRQFDGAGIHVV